MKGRPIATQGLQQNSGGSGDFPRRTSRRGLPVILVSTADRDAKSERASEQAEQRNHSCGPATRFIHRGHSWPSLIITYPHASSCVRARLPSVHLCFINFARGEASLRAGDAAEIMDPAGPGHPAVSSPHADHRSAFLPPFFLFHRRDSPPPCSRLFLPLA